tara:strand:- start:315 stop:533 length:219 start_codon:yes stop_codon:yes gene_type:complete
MKSFIIFNVLAITTINLVVNAHQNHNHQIYNWPNSKNKDIKKDTTVNFEKLEDKKYNPETNNKSNWIKFFRK